VNNLQTELDGKATTSQLNSKQNIITAGDNITIIDNVISSSGGSSEISDINGLQATLNSKQNNLNASSNITVNRLDMGSTYGFYLTDQSIIGTKIFLDTDRLYYKNENGGWEMMITKISLLQAKIYERQYTITDNSLNISHVTNLQSQLDSKQNSITDNSLTIAQVNNLQTELD
jgi:hypothetical protein